MVHLDPRIPRRSPKSWVSSHVSYLLPTHKPSRDALRLTLSGLHPSLEGRGQVAEILGIERSKRMKNVIKHMIRGS